MKAKATLLALLLSLSVASAWSPTSSSFDTNVFVLLGYVYYLKTNAIAAMAGGGGGGSFSTTNGASTNAGGFLKTLAATQYWSFNGVGLTNLSIPLASVTNAGTIGYSNAGNYILSIGGSGTNVTIKSNLTVNVSSKEALILHGPTGGIGYQFVWRSDHLRLTNSIFAGEWEDFQHGIAFGISGTTIGSIDDSSGTALVFTGSGSGLTNIPESAVVGLVSDLAGKQSTFTSGNLTATSPLHFDNTRQVIGGAAVASVDNAAADGSTKGVAAFLAADFNASSGVISLDYANGQQASASQNGFLSSNNWATFSSKASSTAPGSDTQVIFNDGAAYGADSGMTYNKTTDALTLAGLLTAGSAIVKSNPFPVASFSALGNSGCLFWNSNGTMYLICTNSLAGSATTNKLGGL